MSSTYKSSVTSNLKPRNIFYVWYTELCRRSNMNPLAVVKAPKPKNDTVLDFVADRIKPDEWKPILNALSADTSLHVIAIRSRVTGCYFHHEVNSEEKLHRMKKKCGSLWTDYISRSLSISLALCVKGSQVLSCLELDGLPLSMEYLEILLSSLRANKTVRILSLKRCPINDGGCQLVCTNVRLMPSISVLNLSSCNLSSSSGQYIAKVINHQQLNRYSESWHNSLRYEDPETNAMGGIKRITLNNNPGLGEEGTVPILDALDDDLWIKAIDMQNCGVTENLSARIIHLVTHSNSLDVADFRNNEGVSPESMQRIHEAFERRYKGNREPEFFWLDDSSTLHDGSTYGSRLGSRSTLVGPGGCIQKTRSAPLRNFNASEFGSPGQVRRTMSSVERRSRFGKFISQGSSKELADVKKQVTQLKNLLSEETSKRIETEKINNELQKQILGIRHQGHRRKDRLLTPEKIAKIVRDMKDLNRNGTTNEFSKHSANSQVKRVPEKILPDRLKAAPKPTQCHKPSEKPQNLVINLRCQSSKQNVASRKSTPNRLKSKKNVMSPILEVSTPSKPIEKLSAAEIFERMILKQDYDSYILQERNRETTLEYHCDMEEVGQANDGNLSSGSDSSLDKLYREMDEVDQNFSLNCSKSSRSTLIERTFDHGTQHFCMPVRTVS